MSATEAQAREDARSERASRAYLIEIYSGIQGEGLLVGERQIFFRFTSCNLECDYCDTPMTRPLDTLARIEETPGARDFRILPNPVDLESARRAVERLASERSLHSWITFTGGEPLLHARFLERFAPAVREQGLSVYLETNGTLPRELERLLPHVDLVAMGMKETADGADLQTARRFLSVARERDVFVKCVVRPRPDRDHFRRVAAAISEVDPRIPLVLQPVTPYGPVSEVPTPEEVLELQALARRTLLTVRVIPQTHKLIGQM